MATAGDDQGVGGHHRAAIEHQAGDLFAQFAAAGQLVVAQHINDVVLHHPAHLAPERLQAGLGDVRRAAAEGDNRFIAAGFQHIQYLIPLGDLHRALYRARHRRYRRLGFLRGDEVARTRLRGNQLALFQRLIRLLHGADADAVFLAQAANGGQLLAMTIQPLFNPLGQQVGQMLVTRHCCIPNYRHTDEKTSTVRREKPHADTVLANLYVK